MHKQDNTTTDKGLEAIMESMYTEKTIPCDKCNGEGCEHCNGTGTHAVKEDEDTPEDIVFVVIKFIAPEDAVLNPLGVELKAKALLATGVTSKLL